MYDPINWPISSTGPVRITDSDQCEAMRIPRKVVIGRIEKKRVIYAIDGKATNNRKGMEKERDRRSQCGRRYDWKMDG